MRVKPKTNSYGYDSHMEILDNEVLIAKYFSASEIKSQGLQFYSEMQDGIQVGTWNYDKGKLLQPHIHNLVEKVSGRTSEVLYVISGKVHVDIYNEDARLIREFQLNQGDLLICLNGGHGYQILEEGTHVLEVKNGPYFGPAVDRKRIQNECRLQY